MRFETTRKSDLDRLTTLCQHRKDDEIFHECENCIGGIALNRDGQKLAALIAKFLAKGS